MMMRRKFLWLLGYVFILILCLLLIIRDIQKEIFSISKYYSEESIWKSKVEQAQQIAMKGASKSNLSMVKRDEHLLDTSVAVTWMVRFLNASELVINKIELLKVRPMEGVDVLPVKVSVAGEFSMFVRLILLMNSSDKLVLLDDFSLTQHQGGRIDAEMKFYFVGVG